MQLLLDKGAKLGARDSAQCQPIHYAAKNGKVVILKEFIARGAGSYL